MTRMYGCMYDPVVRVKKLPSYKDGKTMRTYRFSNATIERLRDLANGTGKTMTQVLEELIHAAEIDDEFETEGS